MNNFFYYNKIKTSVNTIYKNLHNFKIILKFFLIFSIIYFYLFENTKFPTINRALKSFLKKEKKL